MYRDQEREGHFISPELEYPMICPGIRKGKAILYLLSLNTQWYVQGSGKGRSFYISWAWIHNDMYRDQEREVHFISPELEYPMICPWIRKGKVILYLLSLNTQWYVQGSGKGRSFYISWAWIHNDMYRDQERVGHFISPELEYPMICTGIRKGKVILYLLNLNTQWYVQGSGKGRSFYISWAWIPSDMYRDQERVGHFISPELEYPMICTGIRKGKVILYLLSLNTQWYVQGSGKGRSFYISWTWIHNDMYRDQERVGIELSC